MVSFLEVKRDTSTRKETYMFQNGAKTGTLKMFKKYEWKAVLEKKASG